MNFNDLKNPEKLTRLGGVRLYWATAIPLMIVTIILPMVFGRIVRWFLGLEHLRMNWIVSATFARDILFLILCSLIYKYAVVLSVAVLVLFLCLYLVPSSCIFYYLVLKEKQERRIYGKPMRWKAICMRLSFADFVSTIFMFFLFFIFYHPAVDLAVLALFFAYRLFWFYWRVRSIWGFTWLCCCKRAK
jgi:hypothetical protein